MRYKEGSKVKIKEHHKLLSNSDGYIDGFVSNMKKYCGKTAIITEVHETNNGNVWVRLDIDNSSWNWNIDWLEYLSGCNIIDLPKDLFEI